MKRFLALLLLVATSTVTGTPAAALAPDCKIIEQVYGITRLGNLIVQPFCTTPLGIYLLPRTLASFGEQVPQLFYGGQLSDDRVIIYGVGADGALRWYREDAVTRKLGLGVVVGSQFGDWRGYGHLQVSDNGDLSGVDHQGRLWRWKHLGWQDGTDTWEAAGPEETTGECSAARPVFTGRNGPYRSVAVEAATSSYVYCRHNGETRIASLLPPGVEKMTMAAGPGVTYALSRADHRLTRLVLQDGAVASTWRADAVSPDSFSAIFTGRPICTEDPPPFRYEWQWTYYELT